MANLPSTYDDRLRGGKPEEFKICLRALFEAFPSQHGGDKANQVAAYLEVLRGEPAWAVEAAVRKFIHGKVDTHDGRFLPTSAELAKVVRRECEWDRQQRGASFRTARTREIIDRPPPTAEDRERIAAKLKACSESLVSEPVRRSQDWQDDPKYLRFRQLAAASRERQEKAR